MRYARERNQAAQVRAPISGVVYSREARSGSYVNPGDLIANIGRLERLRVRVYVDEPELGRVMEGQPVTITVLVALPVCLIPTTIGALLSAIGVAGMSRMLGANVLATSGRAIEAAGDVDVLLLDKTGTITLGNRQASEFFPAQDAGEDRLL